MGEGGEDDRSGDGACAARKEDWSMPRRSSACIKLSLRTSWVRFSDASELEGSPPQFDWLARVPHVTQRVLLCLNMCECNEV